MENQNEPNIVFDEEPASPAPVAPVATPTPSPAASSLAPTAPQASSPTPSFPEHLPQFAPPPPVQPEAVAAPVPVEVKYAGFWVRYVARFVDGLVIGVPSVIIIVAFVFISAVFLGTKQLAVSLIFNILLRIILLVLGWSYYIVMTKKYKATLGKMAVGVKVLSDKSGELTWGQIILRETIGKIASAIILCIGYLMAGFTERKQALHDKIAKTVVVYKDPNHKVVWWAIALALVLPAIAIVGILAAIVLVSLSSAQKKASDAASKSLIAAQIPAAIVYYSDHNNSYTGFAPDFSTGSSVVGFQSCAGTPILKISNDGQSMALFVKSCVDTNKYFCDEATTDPNHVGDIVEVDEQYAKSGASVCQAGENNNSNNTISTTNTEPSEQSNPQQSSTTPQSVSLSVDSNGLFTNVSDDIAMLNTASDAAKKWEPDALPYSAIMVVDQTTNEHQVIFKSKSKPGKIFTADLDANNKVISSDEEQDNLYQPEVGYIGIDSLEYSSAQAFQQSEDLAKKQLKNSITDYNKIFTLLYMSEAKANIWDYVLMNKNKNSEFQVMIDASSGKVIVAGSQ